MTHQIFRSHIEHVVPRRAAAESDCRGLLIRILKAADTGDADLLEALYEEARDLTAAA